MKSQLLTKCLFITLIALNAYSDEFPGLGSYIDNEIITINDYKDLGFESDKSDIMESLSLQSPVRSQGRRGTCSIFSAVALLESKLISDLGFSTDINLSEEWVQFLAMRARTSDGYWSYRNWYNISKHGILSEESWPYDPTVWSEDNLGETQIKRCGHLTEVKLKSCLLGHRDHDLLIAKDEEILDVESDLFDPEFFDFKKEVKYSLTDWVDSLYDGSYSWSSAYQLYSVSEVREALKNKNFMTLSIPFFYGAWNHGRADSLGIGKDANNWKKGFVGFPEAGSMDVKISLEKENRAGHSVLVIGYDDNVIIKTSQLMEDGTRKDFEYKGAYIFKNSWGDNSFGVESPIKAGYGLISAKYVHNYGSFYQLR
jgi:hypothetical protein